MNCCTDLNYNVSAPSGKMMVLNHTTSINSIKTRYYDKTPHPGMYHLLQAGVSKLFAYRARKCVRAGN